MATSIRLRPSVKLRTRACWSLLSRVNILLRTITGRNFNWLCMTLNNVTPKVNVTAYTLLPEVNLWVGTLVKLRPTLLCRGLTRPML